MPREVSPGVYAETVADVIGDASEFIEVESALEMPRIEGTPGPLAPGIWFGVPDEVYHAIPAFSKTLGRYILASPTIAWAHSWLNPNKEERKAEHLLVGKAYHAMILEGPDAYQARFYPMPQKADYPDAIDGVAEIKAAIEDRNAKPVSKVDAPELGDGKTRPARKEDWVAQLAALDRSVPIWDIIVAKAQKAAAGRDLISPDDDRRIRVAARMIKQDPELLKAFTGGWPEVTLIWRDERQGVLCKARIDYLKLKAAIDLKSFANNRDRSIRNSIIREIAEHRYALQPAHYLDGIDAVRKLVRAGAASAVHVWEDSGIDAGAATEWALRWASFTGPDRWLWVFQQKGDVPVTRGLYHPLGGSIHMIAKSMMVDAIRRFREAVEIYGTDPWLDLAEIDELTDEDIPAWGLEI